MAAVSPGDVLAVRTPGFAAALIRLGAALRGQPDLDNHIAVAHHVTDGVTWCIEGRPGGVGWRDARDYLASRWTVTNVIQPKSATSRVVICAAMRAAVGTPYDWQGIAQDAAEALGLPEIWRETQWGSRPPGHVVCSSLAAWGYAQAGLAHPVIHDLPHTTPADWEQFMMDAPWWSK